MGCEVCVGVQSQTERVASRQVGGDKNSDIKAVGCLARQFQASGRQQEIQICRLLAARLVRFRQSSQVGSDVKS